MTPKIGTLVIERFRAIRQLDIDGLRRINLITGRNNTGKSSVLEALRILASEASPTVIYDILRFREEDVKEADEPSRPLDAQGLFQLSSLFHGFPRFSANLEPIVIASHGVSRLARLTMEPGWFVEERNADGSRRLVPQQQELFGEGESVPALVIEANGMRRVVPLSTMGFYADRSRPTRLDSADESHLPCVFVSPYGGERTATLGASVGQDRTFRSRERCG